MKKPGFRNKMFLHLCLTHFDMCFGAFNENGLVCFVSRSAIICWIKALFKLIAGSTPKNLVPNGIFQVLMFMNRQKMFGTPEIISDVATFQHISSAINTFTTIAQPNLER